MKNFTALIFIALHVHFAYSLDQTWNVVNSQANIVNKGFNKCVMRRGKEEQLVLTDCQCDGNRKWNNENRGGRFVITNVENNFAFDLIRIGHIIGWPAHGNDNQRWLEDQNNFPSPQWISFRGDKTGKCITTDGNGLFETECNHGDEKQAWSFRECGWVPPPPPKPEPKPELKPEPKPELKQETKPEPKIEVKPTPNGKAKAKSVKPKHKALKQIIHKLPRYKAPVPKHKSQKDIHQKKNKLHRLISRIRRNQHDKKKKQPEIIILGIITKDDFDDYNENDYDDVDDEHDEDDEDDEDDENFDDDYENFDDDDNDDFDDDVDFPIKKHERHPPNSRRNERKNKKNSSRNLC